jgi:hypothetical protein
VSLRWIDRLAFLLSLDATRPFGFGLCLFLHFPLSLSKSILVFSDRFSPEKEPA